MVACATFFTRRAIGKSQNFAALMYLSAIKSSDQSKEIVSRRKCIDPPIMFSKKKLYKSRYREKIKAFTLL